MLFEDKLLNKVGNKYDFLFVNKIIFFIRNRNMNENTYISSNKLRFSVSFRIFPDMLFEDKDMLFEDKFLNNCGKNNNN